jgi:hypothetical protein
LEIDRTGKLTEEITDLLHETLENRLNLWLSSARGRVPERRAA